MTNTPAHETQWDIENNALRAQPTDQSIISKQKTNEPLVIKTIYCKLWLRLCFLGKFMNPKIRIVKHETKESKIKSRLS